MSTLTAPGEIKMGVQLASHLGKLHVAATRLGFSPLVTGAISNAALHASKEAAQAACAHVSLERTSITCSRIRATVAICLACGKTLLIDDV